MSSNGVTVRSFSISRVISVIPIMARVIADTGLSLTLQQLSPSTSMYAFAVGTGQYITTLTVSRETDFTNRVALAVTDVDTVTADKLYTDLLAAMHGTDEAVAPYGDRDATSH